MSLDQQIPVTIHDLNHFVGGWVVGNFQPSLITNANIEVAIKNYERGALEPRHHHRVATEYTIIVQGRVRMNHREYGPGEIIQINPGCSTDFEALESTITVVLKTPSIPEDKFLDSDLLGATGNA